jgi:hypothetical protein
MASNGELEIEGIEKVDALVIKLKDDMLTLVEAFTSVITTNEKLNDSEVKNEKTLKDTIEKRNTQTKAETESAKAKKEIIVKTDELIVTESRAKKLKQDHLTVMKAEAIMNDKDAGAIEKKKAELNKLRVEKERLIATDKNYEKDLKRIIARQNELAQELTETNYSTQKAYWAFGQQLSPAMASAAEQAKNFTAKLGGLNPFVLGLVGTFAAGIGAVVSFFKSSERGAEMLERKMAGLKAAFGVLADEVILAGEKIVESTDKDQNKVGMWTKVFSLLGGAVPALQAKFMALGMTMDIVSKAAETATGMMQDLEVLEREMIVPRAKTNKQIAEAKLLYQDETKSIEIRYNALKKSLDLETTMSDTEVKHQEAVVANIEAQIKLKGQRVRDEDLLKLEQAKAKLYDLQTESLLKQRKVQSTLNAAVKELNKDQIKLIEDNLKAEKEKNTTLLKWKQDEYSEFIKIDEDNQKMMNEGVQNFYDERNRIIQEQYALAIENAYTNDEAIKEAEYAKKMALLDSDEIFWQDKLLLAVKGSTEENVALNGLNAIKVQKAKETSAQLMNIVKLQSDIEKETLNAKRENKNIELQLENAFVDGIGRVLGRESTIYKVFFGLMKAAEIARVWVKTAAANAEITAATTAAAATAAVTVVGLPLVPGIIATGAAAISANTTSAILNTALIAGQSVLEITGYEKGTKDHKGGSAIMGEGTGMYKGHELVTLPDGTKFLTPDHATLYPDLPKHSVVTPANMVEQELRKSFENNQLSKNDNKFMSDYLLRDMNKKLGKIENKKTSIILNVSGASMPFVKMVNERYRK